MHILTEEILSTTATLSGNVIKGTFAYADIQVHAMNGVNLSNVAEQARTDSSGYGEITVESEKGFGITGVVKVEASSNSESLMTCDANNCGDSGIGDLLSGNDLTGTQLSTLTYVTVPFGTKSSSSDASFVMNVYTSFATSMIEDDMKEGRNVSSEQLLVLAQQEYSSLVLKALGMDVNNVNVFTLPVVSADSIDNFVTKKLE